MKESVGGDVWENSQVAWANGCLKSSDMVVIMSLDGVYLICTAPLKLIEWHTLQASVSFVWICGMAMAMAIATGKHHLLFSHTVSTERNTVQLYRFWCSNCRCVSVYIAANIEFIVRFIIIKLNQRMRNYHMNKISFLTLASPTYFVWFVSFILW